MESLSIEDTYQLYNEESSTLSTNILFYTLAMITMFYFAITTKCVIKDLLNKLLM